MDPVSHGLIGLASYSLVHMPTINSAACLGAVMGSIAPDFDIITRIKGDYIYLKHHRVESHSLLGIGMISVVLTILLSLAYKDYSYQKIFLWTLIGGLSHTLFDYLNSYGVALLYPLNGKKYSLNLLMIYDPVFLILCLYIIRYKPREIGSYLILLVVAFLYLLYRWLQRRRLEDGISNMYKGNIESVSVMPGGFNLFKWDYVVDTGSNYLVGQINSITNSVQVVREFKKIRSPIIEKTLEDKLGIYFKNFTPLYHVDLIEGEKNIIVRMTDLRYRIKDKFKHHASFYYDEDKKLIRRIFQPFSKKNVIEIK